MFVATDGDALDGLMRRCDYLGNVCAERPQKLDVQDRRDRVDRNAALQGRRLQLVPLLVEGKDLDFHPETYFRLETKQPSFSP